MTESYVWNYYLARRSGVLKSGPSKVFLQIKQLSYNILKSDLWKCWKTELSKLIPHFQPLCYAK